jgi:hypothetical protein
VDARWKKLAVRGLLLLAVAGCSHGSSAGREKPPGAWATEDSGIRTKGGDSATFHIQALIAQGQFEAAEAYLIHAVAAGLVAREAATRLREKIAEPKQQPNAEQERRVPRGNLEDWEIEETQRRSCATEMPTYPVCRALPEEYVFHSPRQALEAMKQRLGAKSLVLHSPEDTLSGPCRNVGKHYNVRMNGERAGSIVCCPCCVENEPGPLKWVKCRIVW